MVIKMQVQTKLIFPCRAKDNIDQFFSYFDSLDKIDQFLSFFDSHDKLTYEELVAWANQAWSIILKLTVEKIHQK